MMSANSPTRPRSQAHLISYTRVLSLPWCVLLKPVLPLQPEHRHPDPVELAACFPGGRPQERRPLVADENNPLHLAAAKLI